MIHILVILLFQKRLRVAMEWSIVLLHWVLIASKVAVVLKPFILKVKCQSLPLEHLYRLHVFIKVPTEYLQDYKDALGPDCKYIYAWNPDESGDDKPVTPCATPSISYESGELKFASETAGAEYHYTITDADMVSDAYSKEGKVSLSAAYNISVYATADGYAASEKTEATLYWINANLETANINLAKTRGIVASAHDGIVSISGLDNGEVVKFYAADGKLLGSTSAVGGVASCAVSAKMVIAKIGMDSIKVLIK